MAASIEILVPRVSDGVTSAKVAAWLKREGEAIAAGEPLVEIETDKTTFEVEAPGSGMLQQILVKAGTESVPVGTVIGMIGPASVTSASVAPASVAPASTTAGSATPAHMAPVGPQPVVQPRAADRQETRDESYLHESAQAGATQSISASPLATRMMALEGLDAAVVAMTAPGSRIMKADVEAVLRQLSGGMQQSASIDHPPILKAVSPAAPGGTFEERPLTAMRRVTASRLQHAKQTIPHFYLRTECHVDALMELRRQVRDRTDLVKPTITDFLVLAAARALRLMPEANSVWVDSGVSVFERVDIAVAVNTPAGLITPIIRAADQKGIATISHELKDLAERARQGRLRPDEYSGGTFTISNLGMFGVSDITPILNPPQTCILGVGASEQRPVVSGGQIVVGAVMSCTLAADHRAIDGALGAQLLSAIRRMLEEPVSLLWF